MKIKLVRIPFKITERKICKKVFDEFERKVKDSVKDLKKHGKV